MQVKRHSFKKGESGFQGKKHSEETKRKISRAKMNPSAETRLKLRLGRLGKKVSPETLEKMKEVHKGVKNPLWKGDKAKYRAIHMWVQLWLGKATKCSKDPVHKSTRYHWANISGEYKRELSDWRELCPSCNRLDGVNIPFHLYERRQILFRL